MIYDKFPFELFFCFTNPKFYTVIYLFTYETPVMYMLMISARLRN